MSTCDQNAFENLVGCRDLLAFTLTAGSRPPEDLVEPISNMVALLFRGPRVVARFDGSTCERPRAQE